MTPPPAPRAAIVGIAGTDLAPDEADLFRRLPPAGFILFRRNCRDPAQLRALTGELRSLFPDRRPPVLIDQEGGRVQRLAPPHWPSLPPAGRIGRLAVDDPEAGREAARLQGAAIAAELVDVGIDTACAPCLDLRTAETTAAIGDRSFGADPALVASLGRAMIEGLRAGGVAPVIKHLPGHGRARVDSHLALPVILADPAELDASDLVPFRLCRDVPFAMTAHILLPALDPDRPATQSRRIIMELIRGRIGFEGLLLSDDLGMGALAGGPAERALAALDAGCDLGLHCNGDMAEMEALLAAVPALPAAACRQLAAATGPAPAATHDLPALLARLDTLLEMA